MIEFLNCKRFLKFLAFAVIVFAAVQISQAQNLYLISGGTRFESDPDDKKRIVLIAENSELKITFKPSDKFKAKKGQIWAIWMKVENLSDKPLRFDPTQFNATDNEGRALAGLEPKEAIKRFYDSVADITHILGTAIAGPLSGPSMTESAERKATEKLNRESIQTGDIPPKAFKDGIVFFEKPKGKTQEFKVNFVGLWSAPIIFTTDEKRKPETNK